MKARRTCPSSLFGRFPRSAPERVADDTVQMLTHTPRRELLTVKETAWRLRLHSQTVRRMVADGRIPAVQLGGPGCSGSGRRRRARAALLSASRAVCRPVRRTARHAAAQRGPRPRGVPVPRLTDARLRTAITPACKATGTPHFSPHGLRRRRGSLRYKRTGSLAEVAELLGDSKRVAADHDVYAPTDYREVDRSIAPTRAVVLKMAGRGGGLLYWPREDAVWQGGANPPAPTRTVPTVQTLVGEPKLPHERIVYAARSSTGSSSSEPARARRAG